MSAFFYGDIKTDELRIHGHGDNTAGQIELYDATSSNLIILKAPSTISSSNITLTLPSSLSGGANTLLTNTSSEGQLGFVTPGGDISLGGSGTFTVNGISNTATITSTANLTLATGKQLNLGTAGNIGYDSANTNIIISGSNQVITRINGQQVLSTTYTASNSIINLGSTSGESGYGFKNTATGQVQVKPNSSSSWTNLVTHLSNCGDVTISSPANTNALIYNSGTSSWTNRQILLNDISQVSVSGQTSNQALFYNGTNFTNRSPLYTDLTGNVTVLPFLASNVRICAGAGVGGQTQRCIAIGSSAGASGQLGDAIAIGTSAGSGTGGQGIRCVAIGAVAHISGAQPNYSMVLNAGSTSVNALQESSTYIAPIRTDAGNGYRLVYNDTTSEVTKQVNTMIALTDVDDAVDTVDGGCLRYKSDTATYASRGTQYYSYAAYGQLASYASAVQKPIFTGTTWSSRTEDTIYAYPSGKFSINSVNGTIEGFDSTKAYKLEFHVSQNGNNISTNMAWQARILATSNVGSVLRAVRIGQVTDDRAPSLHCVAIVTGYTAYYFDYGLTAGTYSTTVSPDCQISICCHEM